MTATLGAATGAGPATEDVVRRLARRALTLAVRGRRETGEPWGEAVLAELDQTRGRWETVRWSAGGIRAALRERRGRRKDLPRWVRIRRRAAVVLVAGVLAGAGIQHWVVSLNYYPSGSMEPTLGLADYWLLDRVSFRVTGLHYGDIVGYSLDGEPDYTVVRRVIGLPGDVMGCADGRVLRNGTPVDESYLLAGTVTKTEFCPAMTVPEGTVYLLGDHRAVAAYENPIRMDQIEGRMLTRLWNGGPGGSWLGPPAPGPATP